MALTSWSRLVIAVASALCALVLSTGVADAAPPLIASQSVTAVTSTNATLNADINPNGLLTKYKLQIDTTGKFKFFQTDSCPLHPPGIFCAQVIVPGDPLPPGLVEPPESSLPAGIESQHVSVNLASIGATLQPNTTYHFRAIAANSNGFTEGPDQTFTTPAVVEPPPVTGPPVIDSQEATNITSTNATLNADINPNGLLTKYKLQIDTTGKFKFFQTDSCPLHPPGIFCAQVIVPGDPLPPGLVEPPESSLPAGIESQHVSVNLASIGATLQPNTTYHFRAIAANSNGFTEGPDQTFTTPAVVEPPPVTGDEPKPEPAESPSGIVESAPEPSQPLVDAGQPGTGKKASRCQRANEHRRMGRKQRSRKRCAAVATARVSKC